MFGKLDDQDGDEKKKQYRRVAVVKRSIRASEFIRSFNLEELASWVLQLRETERNTGRL